MSSWDMWEASRRERRRRENHDTLMFLLGGLLLFVVVGVYVFIFMVLIDQSPDLTVSGKVKLIYLGLVLVTYLGVLVYNRKSLKGEWAKGSGNRVVAVIVALWLLVPSFVFFLSLPYKLLRTMRGRKIAVNGSQ